MLSRWITWTYLAYLVLPMALLLLAIVVLKRQSGRAERAIAAAA